MSKLSLYEPSTLPLEIERVAPRQLDDCRRCPLREYRQGATCNLVNAEDSGGDGPVLLVVGDSPGLAEEAQQRPFVSKSGVKLRALLREAWPGRIVLDYALRCFMSRRSVQDSFIATCRPFLAHVLRTVKPARVLALGPSAMLSLVGRTASPLNVRRGYAWLWNERNPVPVFFLASIDASVRSRFLWRYFVDDLKWSLRCSVPPPRQFFSSVRMVKTREDAIEACCALSRGEGFAFDLEYCGYMWDPEFNILTLGASPVGGGSAWVWGSDALEDPARWDPLRALLEDEDIPKGGSNVKVDVNALWCAKRLRVRGVCFDTRLQRKLLEPDAPANLADMAELVGMGGHKEEAEAELARIERLITRAAQQGSQLSLPLSAVPDELSVRGFDVSKYVTRPRAIAYAFISRPVLHRYVARDALATARLASLFSARFLQLQEQARLWDRLVSPAMHAIQRVEEWGVPYDVNAGVLLRKLFQRGLEESYAKVQQYALSGAELNPGSSKQLAFVLYDRLGLTCPHTTDKGAPSTDEAALELLRVKHPLPGLVLDYRHYQKMVGYVDDWTVCARSDGRIHPSIHLDGARSGRTSCSDPNLQNIPRSADNEHGKLARNCFVAPKGHVFVQLDYSQLELRVAAYISNDTVMADLFRSGVDFHLGTAKLISKLAWGIEPEQVTKVHRTGAKAFNFGLAYGKTDRTLAADLGITPEAATQIRQAIFGAFRSFGEWSKEAVAYARLHGGCWTVWEGERARWRSLWQIGDETEDGAGAAVRARNGAINTPIQGTASDICIASLVKLVRLVESGAMDAEIILPIHDSIMLLCPEKTWKDAARMARDVMVDYPWFSERVPLAVDIEVGERWGDLEKVGDLGK